MINQKGKLADQYGRNHDYLRISLTERCNLRCQYCMPEEGIPLTPSKNLMTASEIGKFAEIFVGLGVKKIRLTGGEPLLRKDFAEIVRILATFPVEISITTNGILLDRNIELLQELGIRHLNFSLDTLREERFLKMTRRTGFQKTMENFQLAIREKFLLKINCVLMKGENDDEIIDFIRLSENLAISVRFIEFMPFDGNKWNKSKLVTEADILSQVEKSFGLDQLIALPNEKNLTARKFKINGFQGDFGIISSVTNPFCSTCNRIRLTANGKIKNCLFSNSETDLLTVMRAGGNVIELIEASVYKKKAVRAGMDNLDKLSDPELHSQNRSMIAIGG